VGTVGGLSWFDGDTTWHHYNDTPGSYAGLQLPGNNIAALCARSDGALCIGTVNAGFTYLTDSTVTVYTTFSNGLPDNTALGVALDGQGSRWLACPAGALLNHAGDLVGGAWVQFSTVNSLLPSNSLTCIEVDGWDRKLIGNQISGFTIFQGFSSFTTYTMQNSDLPGDEVLSLALDGAGNVWIGTSSGGAARFGYAVGLEEQKANDGMVVFPNPVTDDLRFVHPAADGGRYRLLDLSGRVLSMGPSSSGTTVVDLRDVATGTYVLEAFDAGAQRLACRRIQRL
jgi:ligand-binding sensor domain-containing protein